VGVSSIFLPLLGINLLRWKVAGSSVRELASISFGRNHRGVFLALRVYLDGSGKENDNPVITVGGYVADSEVCDSIEDDWLKATDGRTFHLTDFGTKECKLGSADWDIEKRCSFLKQLAAIVNRDGCKLVSASLEVAPYNSFVLQTANAHVHGPAFSGCAQACVALAEFILEKEDIHRQQVAYVFELGDRQHEVAKMIGEWKELKQSDRAGLRGLSFQPKATTLLQPADLIAGVIHKSLLNAYGALPCLENGFSRTPLHNYERYYSSDGVTAAAVSGHDRERCWVVNPKTFAVLDQVTTAFFERNPRSWKGD